MGNQRVDQRSGLISGRRVHHQALGLVDDDQRIIFVYNGKWNILGQGLGRGVWGDCQFDCVASVDAVAWIADRSTLDSRCERAKKDKNATVGVGAGRGSPRVKVRRKPPGPVPIAGWPNWKPSCLPPQSRWIANTRMRRTMTTSIIPRISIVRRPGS